VRYFLQGCRLGKHFARSLRVGRVVFSAFQIEGFHNCSMNVREPSGRRRFCGPGAGRAIPSHSWYTSCAFVVSTKTSP
jgi:hypothetical protein